jgi:hypothetical protein
VSWKGDESLTEVFVIVGTPQKFGRGRVLMSTILAGRFSYVSSSTASMSMALCALKTLQGNTTANSTSL